VVLVGVLMAVLAPVVAVAQQGDPLLAKGIRQVEDGSLEDATVTLDAAIRRLSALEGRQEDLARAHLYKGIAAAQLGLEKVARAAFREALALEPSLQLSPERWPRSVTQAFSSAKAETVPASSPAPSTPGSAERPRTGTVVVYSDYLCAFSQRFAQRVPGMRAAWGDRVTLQVKNFPLDQACNPSVTKAVHPGACTLALGAICARGQGRFWEYYTAVFSNPPPNASPADAARIAAAAGLDRATFSGCLGSPQTRDQLAAEIAEATAAGVNSTPLVFVNGKQLGFGAPPQATLDRELGVATAASTAAAPGEAPRDPGIDTAVVRVPLAALRESASSSARVLLEARQGTVLALVSREASGGFYRVIEIESAKQGFVRAEDVEVRLTAQPRAASPFQAQRVDDTSPPAVTVTNDSDLTMTLTLDADVHNIAPRSARTLTVRPGRLSYVATAPGVLPAIGTEEFAKGHAYTWRFWVSR
jgi:protein-disulfide isomerase